MLQLYDTMQRSVREFTPLEAGKVRMYTCGLTVYSHPSIGNWVAYIYSDVLHRVLKYAGYEVIRTQNITDVGHLVSDDDSGEDKMEKGARKEGLDAWQTADKYIAVARHEALEMLGLLLPTNLVRATSLIPQQIAFVQKLEADGYTYRIEGDGIYFDTSRLRDYGKLARLDIAGLEAGARVPVDGKRQATDFAIWKFSPAGQKRDMEWDSPWGKGFPGWHLECSVIARETLGDQLDIHTGGIDHIPVHHTNEIAQTEAVTGKPFVRYWFHSNHIKVNGTKMSKSLGNVYTLEDLQNKGFSIAAFKLMVLSKHYRTEGNFTWDILEASQNRLKRWLMVADLRWQLGDSQGDTTQLQQHLDGFIAALHEDLGTPQAVATVDAVMDFYEQHGMSTDNRHYFDELSANLRDLFGIDILGDDINEQQRKLLASRQEARENKDWAMADKLRTELETSSITVRDTPGGQIWQRC